MCLEDLQKNQKAIIVGFNLTNNNLLKRLYDIGLRINLEITVVKKSKKGCNVIAVDGRLIALSSELLTSVLVKV